MPTPIRPNQPTIPEPYTSLQEIQEDITAIFRDEMAALADEGVTYLQLDKVPTRFVDPEAREAMRARGVDPDAEFAAEVALENSCYDAARREGITLAMHFCRGSRLWWQGGSGPYEAIAEQAFAGCTRTATCWSTTQRRREASSRCALCPKASPSTWGSSAPRPPRWRTRTSCCAASTRRQEYIDLDQLGIGPQCGFQGASERDGAHLTIDEQRRKLELIVDTARKVWG